jgi:hypothetical protein
MKNRLQQCLAEIKTHRHLWVALAITLVVATVYYFAWSIPQTFAESTHIGFNMEKMDNNMWWSFDARDYRDTGDFFFGRSDSPVLNRRPWLYPLVVGTLRTITPFDPDLSLWALQFTFWLLTISLIFLTLVRATGKIWLALLATAVFWTHPSPIVMTFHGMTETLNILLLSVLAYYLFSSAAQKENRNYWVIFLFSLLLATKPTYQLQLAVFLLYVLFVSLKKWRLWRFWGKIALALLPLWIQFFITWQVLGYATVSDVGGHTLKYWTLTRVYARAEGMDDLRQIADIVEDWTTEQEIAYLLNHKQLTLTTYIANIVDEGLIADSYFIVRDDNPMNIAIQTLNKGYFYLHLLMTPLMLYLLFFYRKGKWEAIWILYLSFAIQIAASGVSADQGDRLMITALPLWILSYAFVFANLRDGVPVLQEEKTIRNYEIS